MSDMEFDKFVKPLESSLQMWKQQQQKKKETATKKKQDAKDAATGDSST